MKKILSQYKSLVFIVSACICLSSNASTYKSTDSHGNIIYSDTPSGNTGEIKLPTRPSVNLFPAQKHKNIASKKPPKTDKITHHTYTSLKILQPQEDNSLRSNAGTVSVALQIEPKLHDGDMVSIKIDGLEITKVRKSTLTLNNINRGSHSLEAFIINPQGQVLKRSKALRFHLHRQSALLKPSANKQ